MLFGDRSCPVLSGVPDPLPEGFRRDFAGATRTPCSGSFSPLGEGVCLLRDRDSGKADDLVISALWQSKRGTARCASDAKRGRSFHGGHTRSDPRCVLHGCSSEDVKGIQAFLRQKQIDDAVQDYLNRGDDPMPPQTLATPTTGGSSESTRLCMKCLKGETSHPLQP